MSNHLYYREIVDTLFAHLHLNYDDATCIHQIFVDLDDECEDLSSLCAEAAKVLDLHQDLFSGQFIEWNVVLELYADLIKDFLLNGQIPSLADQVILCAQSISNHTSVTTSF